MVTKLTEGVWWIDLPATNAYIVVAGGDVTLVDTGTPWQARAIRRAVTTVAGGLRAVDRVLVTHVDLDHVGGLHRLEGLDAPVHVGAADAPYLRKERAPPWRTRKGLFQRATDWWRPAPDLPVEAVADGDEVGPFTAYHTPGHTPGHTAFVAGTPSVGLLGDLVREANGRLEPTPWYLNADTDQVRASVRDLLARAPDFAAACVGHGTPFATGGSERLAACAGRLGG